jgi:hypothetical protein
MFLNRGRCSDGLFSFSKQKQGEESRDLLFTLLFAGLVNGPAARASGTNFMLRHVA